MSIGSNIRKLRENMKDGSKLTQEKLAEEIGVSFQAVSAWERDEYLPETANVLKLMSALDASADAILDDRKWEFKTKKKLFDWEHMKTYVKTTAKNQGMSNTLVAIDFAVEAHKGQNRKNTKDIPYIYHPLNMACHALAMGIKDDEIIAGILLHDVIEDCKKPDKSKYVPEDLPVSDETREIVRLMTHEKEDGEKRDKVMKAYYNALAANPKAALVKCIDRCNNLTTMSWGLSREKMHRMIVETEKYYPSLLKAIKDTAEFNDAAWLLQYQMESMLDIYKRLI